MPSTVIAALGGIWEGEQDASAPGRVPQSHQERLLGWSSDVALRFGSTSRSRGVWTKKVCKTMAFPVLFEGFGPLCCFFGGPAVATIGVSSSVTLVVTMVTFRVLHKSTCNKPKTSKYGGLGLSSWLYLESSSEGWLTALQSTTG